MRPNSETTARQFEVLFDEHCQAILGYALRRVKEPADAADVVSETFVVVWRRMDAVPNEDTRLWLYGVARRVLANARRGEMRRDRLGEMQSPDFEAFAAGAITGADVLESVRSSGTDLSRVIGFDPVGLNVELHASES